MKILICDNCGHEAKDSSGIIGGEFEYHGFKTLDKPFRKDGIVDLCKKCFDELQKEVDKEHNSIKNWRQRAVNRFLGAKSFL